MRARASATAGGGIRACHAIATGSLSGQVGNRSARSLITSVEDRLRPTIVRIVLFGRKPTKATGTAGQLAVAADARPFAGPALPRLAFARRFASRSRARPSARSCATRSVAQERGGSAAGPPNGRASAATASWAAIRSEDRSLGSNARVLQLPRIPACR